MKKIYLLPGIMCNQTLWKKMYLYFDDNYELIHLEIPLKKNLDEIVSTLNREIKDDKINLLGFSLGGYIASLFAVKYPNKINKLFIVACSLCEFSNEEIIKRKNAIAFTKKFGFKGLSRKKIISLLEKENQNDNYLIELIQKMYIDLGEDVFLSQFFSTLNRPDLLNKLLCLNKRVTFLYSINDGLVNINWLNKLESLSSNYKFIKINGSSHMLPLEKPKELSTEIKNWIN
ncbi:MAG: alpha/beta hydrolase [Arcobacter sp.]|nr:alpha/beta hydrolase [Arcobacter sp.]